MRKITLLALMLLGAVAIGVSYSLLRESSSVGAVVWNGEFPAGAPAPGKQALEGDAVASLAAAEVERGSRVEASAERIPYHITDPEGRPIEGVEITWHAKGDLPSGWQRAWGQGAEIAGKPIFRQYTKADGSYPTPPRDTALTNSTVEVVVWFTKPEWMGAVRRYEREIPVERWGEDVVLQQADPVDVLVWDAKGNPVGGAEVELTGALEAILTRSGDEGAELLPIAIQTGTTDASGMVAFCALPGAIEVHAREGEREAIPYFGSCQPQIDLRLMPSFAISGRLTTTTADTEGIQPRLRAEVRHKGTWQSLTKHLIKVGEWGPFRIPVLEDAEQYRLIVEGVPVVAEVRAFPPPSAEEELFFNIQIRRGNQLVLWPIVAETLSDPEQTLVFGARGLLLSACETGWHESWFDARKDGAVVLDGLPDGQNYCRVVAKGYQPSTDLQVVMPLGEGVGDYYMALEPSGTLRGTVFLGDESDQKSPEDFEVVVWPLGNPSNRVRYSFYGSVDGRFEIDSPPQGDLAITASTPTHPAILPMVVKLEKGQAEEVDLVLLPGGPITGRALDSETREPVVNATVQLYIQGAANPVTPWGAPRNVEADGTFHLAGSVPRENFVYLVAEGYSSRYLSAYPDEEGRVDFGDILFSPQSSLIVHVTGLSDRLDLQPKDLQLSLDGPSRISLPLKETSGGDWGAVFSPINAGSYRIDLMEGANWLRSLEVNVSADSELAVELPAGGKATLAVTLVGGTPEQRKLAFRIDSYPTDEGGNVLGIGESIAQDGPTLIPGLPEGSVRLEILADDSATILGAGTFDAISGIVSPVELSFVSRYLKVHVTDQDGVPLEGARVTVQYSDAGSVAGIARADSEGVVSFADLERKPMLVSLEHSQAGRQLGIEVDGSRDELFVVLDGGGALDVSVSDSGSPVEGVSVSLMVDQSYQLARIATDASGHARFEHLGPSKGMLLISGASLWEERVSFESHDGETTLPISVWATGSAKLVIRDGEGSPLAGIRIDLVHGGSRKHVSDWIAEGRVAEGSDQANAAGELVLSKVPHGLYRCTITAPGFLPFSGSLEVPAHDEVVVPFILERE